MPILVIDYENNSIIEKFIWVRKDFISFLLRTLNFFDFYYFEFTAIDQFF